LDRQILHNHFMLMQPSQADVRRFFCEVYAKWQSQEPMNALETLTSQWIAEHPEHHPVLSDVDAALRNMEQVNPNADNPFLHLSMHLSISEQCSIDQPLGIRPAVEQLAHRLGSLHQAHHHTMDCLGRMIWESQQSGRMPDGNSYIDCVRRHSSKD
jgi:hypothetical protein